MCFLVFRPYLDAIVIYEKEKEAHSRIILKYILYSFFITKDEHC